MTSLGPRLLEICDMGWNETRKKMMSWTSVGEVPKRTPTWIWSERTEIGSADDLVGKGCEERKVVKI